MNSHCLAESKEKLDKLLGINKLVVISKLGHSPSNKIKKLLKENSIEFYEADITHPDFEDLFPCIYEKSKVRFAPQIFFNTEYIGGYTEGLNYLVQGKFNKI